MNNAYPQPIDNPQLLDDIVRLVSEELNPLDLELIADNFRQHGYVASVVEARWQDEGYGMGEVKFAGDKETGNDIGIDTTHGHRWTISFDGGRQRYKLLDHKLGVLGYYDTPNQAKGAAIRAVGNEDNKTPVDSYNADDSVKPSYDPADSETLPVEKLRKLFPGHYLTK